MKLQQSQVIYYFRSQCTSPSICAWDGSFTQFDIKMRRIFMTYHQICYANNTTAAICELIPVFIFGWGLCWSLFVLFCLICLCSSGVTCLSAYCCFSELALLKSKPACWSSTQRTSYIITLKCNLFSPWYTCKNCSFRVKQSSLIL